jgi:hypothetical protein
MTRLSSTAESTARTWTWLEVERPKDRLNMSTAFLATDLVSDQPGVAAITVC